ncbi:MAG: biopolymer transporter ExbD [Deltaproteobacteria bacterium]|nr:biopolymer transporter ExbD [Deltaproteobacteria bacterium]MDD9827866.1 biopolymer transporter ExbD [Deltaproteobacteria bacterium]MDD9852554.1 biopolymer transporter ExbD [Deltaproteobacteria bacterium]MDD9872184.1 biopolymer transporter ExbD [Deltaproteobacteria bacterium]
MARRHRRIEAEDSEVNLTPMLDVVFILLIFFIVTASFVKEAGIEVNKPDAQTAEKQERANILVAIDRHNQVWVNRRRIDIRAVTANVQRLLAENPQSSVVIQADQKSENGVFVRVMDNIKLAGVDNIAIAARESN